MPLIPITIVSLILLIVLYLFLRRKKKSKIRSTIIAFVIAAIVWIGLSVAPFATAYIVYKNNQSTTAADSE